MLEHKMNTMSNHAASYYYISVLQLRKTCAREIGTECLERNKLFHNLEYAISFHSYCLKQFNFFLFVLGPQE
jgi:hypothetical protein